MTHCQLLISSSIPIVTCLIRVVGTLAGTDKKLTDFDGSFDIGVPVDKHMADALGMAQHGDRFRLSLDRSHELVRSTWNDQIDVAFQLHQLGDVLSSAHLLKKIGD